MQVLLAKRVPVQAVFILGSRSLM